MLGVEPREFIGQPLGWRSDPESRSKLLDMLDGLISGRESQASLEFSTRHANGSPKILRVNAAPLFDELGKINAVVSSARDITDIKLAMESSSNSEKFAAMGQMLTGAAHELNNPLTAILGVSDLLRESAVDDLSRRQANLIFQQGRRAAGIVQNLLAFSRPPSQGRPKINLDEVVRQALRPHEALFKQKHSRHAGFAEDIPGVEGRPEASNPGLHEHHRQRGESNFGFPRLRQYSRVAGCRGKQSSRHFCRRRPWHSSSRHGKNLRSVFYDETSRWKPWIGAYDLSRDCEGAWRNN